MITADDSDATCAFIVVAEEGVSFDEAAVAVAEGVCTARSIENVSADDVAAGFARDDLGLAITGFEKVVLDDAVPVFFGVKTLADLNRLEAVVIPGSAI